MWAFVVALVVWFCSYAGAASVGDPEHRRLRQGGYSRGSEKEPEYEPTPQPTPTASDDEEGYLFSGYGCDRRCDGGDVNYEIEAKLATYAMPGATAEAAGLDGQWAGDASVFTRTFEGVRGPFCNGDDGTTGPVGPCLQMRPGQTIALKVVNNMFNGMERLRQSRASKPKYWEQTQEEGLPDLDQVAFPPDTGPNEEGDDPEDNESESGWLNEVVDLPAEMDLTSSQNFPGWDRPDLFDVVNVHFHGLQVVPHLFYPQGSSDPGAPWISIAPGECFCYALRVPDDQAQGLFWYHIHRHGATAMQAWQAMVGEVQVLGPQSPGEELAKQGVTTEAAIVIWEWAFGANRIVQGTEATFYEGLFREGGGDVTLFPVGNAVQPVVATLGVGETLHAPLLCAQTTTGSVLSIRGEDGERVTLWAFAADGISWSKAYPKQMIVVASGQREALLVQFDTPGNYTLKQAALNDFQNQGQGPRGIGNTVYPDDETTIATFKVVLPAVAAEARVDLSKLEFTPGMKGKGIKASSVSSQLSVNFEVQTDLTKLPIPQFVIDGQGFDVYTTTRQVVQGTAVQWQLTSNMNYFHPFHIHVNPFQVKQMSSGFLVGPPDYKLAVFDSNLAPTDMWRDTVLIPPFGIVTIWQTFDNTLKDDVDLRGKAVFHCHFLDHEDQGMMASFVIQPAGVSREATGGCECC